MAASADQTSVVSPRVIALPLFGRGAGIVLGTCRPEFMMAWGCFGSRVRTIARRRGDGLAAGGMSQTHPLSVSFPQNLIRFFGEARRSFQQTHRNGERDGTGRDVADVAGEVQAR